MKKIEILSTLGPATLNKKFLEFATGVVDLFRINNSHIKINQLKRIINLIRRYSNIPICLDTEGAQIRTKTTKSFYYKKNKKLKIMINGGNFNLYPKEVFEKIRVNDELEIGFEGLKIKIIKKNKNFILAKALTSGLLENNRGVHLNNRFMKLKYITKKDLAAIKIAKSFKIKNFALSFTNSVEDMKNFIKLLPKEKKIYKIETKYAVKNFDKLIQYGDQFLIDRGDLSKNANIEEIPLLQRKIFKISNKFRFKKIYVATNLLESMITNKYPTRGEANDIFNSLEMGAAGLVLAGETAIGKHPIATITFLKKIIRTFLKHRNLT